MPTVLVLVVLPVFVGGCRLVGMGRWCEIFADSKGRLVVWFFEHAPDLKLYADYVSDLPVPPEVETAYAECGPFGKRSGCIPRVRVVS